MTNADNASRSRSRSELVQTAPITIRVVQPVAEENMAAKLIAFQVTTDSVVATARLVFDSSHSRVSLHWGDDTIDEINLNILREKSTRLGGVQEPNTLELQHIYRAPLDHGRRIILAKTRSADGTDAWNHAVVDILQRYEFNFYPATLYFPEHLDSYFEQHSEAEVRLAFHQNSDLIKSKVWVEEIVTNPNIGPIPGETESISWRLPGSEFSTELSYDDDPIYIHLWISEHDGPGRQGEALNILWDFITTPLQWFWWVAENIPFEFDTSAYVNPFSLPMEVHPKNILNGKYSTSFSIPYEGKIIVVFDIEMKLIMPVNKEFTQLMSKT